MYHLEAGVLYHASNFAQWPHSQLNFLLAKSSPVERVDSNGFAKPQYNLHIVTKKYFIKSLIFNVTK